MLKVTLVKSIIGNTPANRATVHALGLRKIGQSNTFEPNSAILGMIHKVKHLLKVEEVTEGKVVRRRQGLKATGATKAAPKASEDKPAKAAKATKAAEPKKAAAKPAAKKATTAKAADDKPKTTRKKKSEETAE